MPTGVWGPPTSSIDWCELNHVHSPLVAELFNSVSSGAMVLAGILGIWLHRRVLERRFLLAFALLIVVGLGSTAFHATLRFELQLLDELPLLYLVLLIVWILVEDGPAPRRPALTAGLVAWGVLLTALTALARGAAQFWFFQISFGSLELFALASVYRLHRRSSSPDARRLFRLGMGAYATAILAWFVDLRFCALLDPNPQLHAAWHVLVSAGFYALLLVVAHHRGLAIGRPVLLSA
jgi:dihydroceramidase